VRTPSTQGAGGLLAHFIPRAALRDTRDLALQFRQDELVRAYAVRHWWLIVPAGMLFMYASALCIVNLVPYLLHFAAPTPPWLMYSTFALAPLLWVGIVIAQVVLLFNWLEKRALEDMSGSDPTRSR
jgi:hypothetical protein